MVGILEWLTGGAVDGLPLERETLGQYEYWRDPADFVGRDALFVVKGRRKHRGALPRQRFEKVRLLDPVTIDIGGREVEQYSVWSCVRFKGLP